MGAGGERYEWAIKVEVAGTTAMREGKVVGENDAYAQTTYILQVISDALHEVGAASSKLRMLVNC